MRTTKVIVLEYDPARADHFVAVRAEVALLEAIGYVFEGDLGIKDRYAFGYENKPHLQTHHLYVCPQASAELHRHLTFRDYLRAHPEEAARYSRVKQEAAKRYPDDIDRYIEYKSSCIEERYRKCGLP